MAAIHVALGIYRGCIIKKSLRTLFLLLLLFEDKRLSDESTHILG